MASANVFAQYLQPQRGVSDYLADYDAQDLARERLAAAKSQNALAALTMQETQAKTAQAARKRNALQQIAAGWTPETTTDQRIATLRANPDLWDEADALEKSDLERQKTRATVGKDNAETLKQHLEALKVISGGVMANPTPQNAAAALGMWERLTGREATEDRAILAQLTTPEQIRQWAASHALTADKLLPQFHTRDTGGKFETLAVDPLTARPTVTSTTAKTATPDAVLSASTSRANNADTIAAADRREAATRDKPQWDSERGVWVTPNGKSTPAMGADGKPLGPKDKALTEGQAKANLFGTRMAEADKILSQLATSGGADRPGLIKRVAEGTANVIPEWAGREGIANAVGAATNWTQSESQQQAEQAQRDFINAVLRRESGAAIAPSEFSNAQKQYFPQAGDTPAVLAQKARNRQTAIAGMLAEVPEGKRSGGAAPSKPAAGAPKVVDFGSLK